MVITRRAHMLLVCAIHHLTALIEGILSYNILIAYFVSYE